MFSVPGPTELIIILVIVLLIFGGGKLAGVGKSLGTAIRDFKDAVTPEEEEAKKEGGAIANDKRDEAPKQSQEQSEPANAEHKD